MRPSALVELVSGTVAGAVGVLGLGYAVLGPTYSNGYGTASMLQLGLHPRFVPFLIAFLLAAVGAAVGAYLHAEHRLPIGLAVLWLSAVVLLLGAIFSMGLALFLLPAAVPALVAAVAGSVAVERPARG